MGSGLRFVEARGRVIMHKAYLDEIVRLIYGSEIYKGEDRIENWEDAFGQVVSMFLDTRRKQKRLFFCGNGGSAAIASHMTADFMKNGRIHTVSMYDGALLTCMGNDYGYKSVFSEPLKYLVEAGDLLVVISSSGNSENIVNAIQAAKEKGADIVTFTGFLPDNKVKHMGTYNIYVPSLKYGMVESVHNLLLQQIVDELMDYSLES